MAGITPDLAQSRLMQYMDAEAKVLKGQSVTIDGESLTRANLTAIQDGIQYWDAKAKELASLAQGRGRARTVAPRW